MDNLIPLDYIFHDISSNSISIFNFHSGLTLHAVLLLNEIILDILNWSELHISEINLIFGMPTNLGTSM